MIENMDWRSFLLQSIQARARRPCHDVRRNMNAYLEQARFTTRRHFLQRCNTGIGAIALASLMGKDLLGNESAAITPAAGGVAPFGPTDPNRPMAPRQPMIRARAKRVIYLHMSGSP